MGTDIGKRIRFQRESLRITQEELAKKLGYKNKSSIAKIEIGENDIPQSKVVAFANALNTTVAYLMGWVDNANSSSDYIDDLVSKHPDIHRIEKRSFPMLGTVACGKPIMADQQYDSFILAEADIDADYCLTASGDSMINARIFDGDIVFVKKQDMVDNGDIAVVIIDDDVTLKRVFYYPETQTLRLQAENPQYKPFVFTGEELEHVHILGKAVFFQSMVR